MHKTAYIYIYEKDKCQLLLILNLSLKTLSLSLCLWNIDVLNWESFSWFLPNNASNFNPADLWAFKAHKKTAGMRITGITKIENTCLLTGCSDETIMRLLHIVISNVLWDGRLMNLQNPEPLLLARRLLKEAMKKPLVKIIRVVKRSIKNRGHFKTGYQPSSSSPKVSLNVM